MDMKRMQVVETLERPALRAVLGYVRAFSHSRAGLLVLGGGTLALAAGLNWSWLVAAGIAPILLGILPCAAMCALGLCMPGMMGRKQSDTPEAPRDITLQARTVASSARLQLAPSGDLSAPLVATRQLAEADISEAQSCCSPSQPKENLDAKST